LWTTELTGTTQIALADDRIGVLTANGIAKVKDGGLSALWTDEDSGVSALVLS
jgi:hypothetical protein